MVRINTVLVGALGLVGVLYGASLLISAEDQPRAGSYREAVRQVLGQHNIEGQDIEVIDGCAPSLQFCHTYVGEVHIAAGRAIAGQIACKERWTTCTLTVVDLGIHAELLPDIRDPLLWRWEQIQAAVIRWVRRAGQPKP